MRFRLHYSLPVFTLSLLSACGGGGGGSSGGTPPAPPQASVSLAVTTAPLNMDIAAGDEAGVKVEGTWSGQNLGAPVYLGVRDSSGRFIEPPMQTAAGASFSFAMTTRADLAPGTYAGSLDVLACKDAACAASYPGAVKLAYTVKAAAVGDWEMHQRDAAHTGYVPVTLNPARFAKAWEWARTKDDPIGGINPVVTAGGKVYVTTDVYFGQGIVYALNEKDGSEAWRRALGQVPAFGPPSVSKGRVYAAVTGHEETALWAFDAGAGDVLFKGAFNGQWPHVMAPTVIGDQVLTGAGYYGGETYSFSASTGVRNWMHQAGGVWDMWAPAADDTYVYHHNGAALFIIDRATGATVAKIDDLLGKASTSEYHGGPILGSRRNAISFAGGAFSGMASSNTEQYDQRVLSSFDLAQRRYNWSTANAYLTTPALAGGVLYAGRNTPAVLDAMEEATGKVLWSWFPPESAETLHRNIIVTRNLLFVSTDRAVYAIDLATRKSVWRYPEPGMLALSADRTLYIATGGRASDGKLVAIRLK